MDPQRVFYAQAVYGREEIDAVVDVLENSSLALMNGARVKEFERRVAKLFAKRHGFMVNSGSSANLTAITALGLEPGSEVITPALTFATTVAPLLQNGLVPVFVDVEPDTFNIDAEQVEAMIGPQTRAMMVPNLIGNLPDWPRLRSIADAHDLILVEDSADTIGSTIAEAPAGRFSDISTTSFYASHIVTAGGFGGLVATRDDELSQRIELLRGWGRRSAVFDESEAVSARFGENVDGIAYDAKFIFDAVGYNFLPSEMSAAFGLVQLDRLDEYTNRRIENFARLREFFSEHEDKLVMPRQLAGSQTPWLAFAFIVRPEAPFTRTELQTHLEEQGIQTRPIFTGNITRQPGFRDAPRRDAPGGYPNADAVMRGGMLVGCHQGMDKSQTDVICETFDAFVAAQ